MRAPLLLCVGVAALAACAPEEPPRTPTANQPPVVVLDVPERVATGESFAVDASASFDVDGDVVEAVIRFGDDRAPELFLRADHRYDEPGLYLLEVYVADDQGARARAQRRVLVE